MKTKTPDARRLDVLAFAAEEGRLEGHWPLMSMSRLAGSAADGMPVDGQVQWRAAGERRRRPGADPETWLHLRGATALPMQCQRCLQPVQVPLAVDARIRFVRSEVEAAELDAEAEHDVLAAGGAVNLMDILEDEFLMALPYVPRHDQCPLPVPAAAAPPTAAPGAEDVAGPGTTHRPFEALKGWKPG